MHRTTEYLKTQIKAKPDIALVLGSGLGKIADLMVDPITIPYSDIPGFPQTTVVGHEGKMMFGELLGKRCVILSGRFHYYEGHTPTDIVQPVRTLKELGVEQMLLTNAAGGINRNYQPGDLMIIEDHINFAGVNPLIGPNDETVGPRFFVSLAAYVLSRRHSSQKSLDPPFHHWVR